MSDLVWDVGFYFQFGKIRFDPLHEKNKCLSMT